MHAAPRHAAPIDSAAIEQMGLAQLRSLARVLVECDARAAHEIHWRDAKIDKLSFEIAQLRRQQYGRRSEQLAGEQKALFDEGIEADIAAVEAQLEQLRASLPRPSAEAKGTPKRAALPANLPRREIRHEPEHTDCGCGAPLKRIGEDVAEKLDYTPGVFTVERHIRGKWACAHCRTLTQASVPASVIDKGIPTAGLLAQVLVAKHADHLPLYRQEQIFGRAGLAIPRATLAAWVGQCGVQLQPLVDALKDELLGCAVLHADETPVAMLAPGTGKTHRAYLWAYAAGPREPIKAVVYDFTDSRCGEHARRFLGHGSNPPERPPWTGRLVGDDFAGYKALFGQGVTEVGCMAHARRKFVELLAANQSTIATEAIVLIRQLYAVERDIHDLDDDARRQQRQAPARAQPIAKTLHDWLTAQRARVTDGTATAKAIDYSLNRWTALMRYLADARLPIDNNHDEQQIRPWATGRKNWLFAGTLAAVQRAAAITSLIQRPSSTATIRTPT
jgi:transposase